jgi:hypothetical protein
LLTGDTISPRGFDKNNLFTKTYLNQLTHGTASGFFHDDKKYVRLKIAGGTM